MRGEPSGGVGIDGPVALELGRLVWEPEQGEHRHRHVDARPYPPDRRCELGMGVRVDEGMAKQLIKQQISEQISRGCELRPCPHSPGVRQTWAGRLRDIRSGRVFRLPS